jgi:hypothetical protein
VINNQQCRYGINHLLCLNGCFIILVISIIISQPTDAEDITWDYAGIKYEERWSSHGGDGEDLIFDFSPDGSYIVLSGYVEPNDLRVMERNMFPVTELHPPGPFTTIKGVHWSPMGTWIVTWGSIDSEDFEFLAVWDGITYERVQEPFINTTGPFMTINSVIFMQNDELMAIAGLYDDGISRVMLIETSTGRLINYLAWEDNTTVLSIVTDSESLICSDERGMITIISIEDWSNVQVFEGRSTRPSSHSYHPSIDRPWLVGYDDGWIHFWNGDPLAPAGATSFTDNGPIQGVAWASSENIGYYVVATPRHYPNGGSWIFLAYYNNSTATLIPMDHDDRVEGVNVTMLMSDPVEFGCIWAGFADGSLARYRIYFREDLPPEITIDYPENGSKHNESFYARGDHFDDNGHLYGVSDVQYVKIRVDDGEWDDVHFDVEGTHWSYYIRVSNMTSGKHKITVESYDGRHNNHTDITFIVPGEEEGPSYWVSSSSIILIIICVTVPIIVYIRYRRIRKN